MNSDTEESEATVSMNDSSSSDSEVSESFNRTIAFIAHSVTCEGGI